MMPHPTHLTRVPVTNLSTNRYIAGRITLHGEQHIALLEEWIPDVETQEPIAIYTPLMPVGAQPLPDDRTYYAVHGPNGQEVYTPHREYSPTSGQWTIITHVDQARMILVGYDRARAGRDLLGGSHD